MHLNIFAPQKIYKYIRGPYAYIWYAFIFWTRNRKSEIDANNRQCISSIKCCVVQIRFVKSCHPENHVQRHVSGFVIRAVRWNNIRRLPGKMKLMRQKFNCFKSALKLWFCGAVSKIPRAPSHWISGALLCEARVTLHFFFSFTFNQYPLHLKI